MRIRTADTTTSDHSLPTPGKIGESGATRAEVHLRHLAWSAALAGGLLDIQGPERLRRAVPSWLTLSDFAAVPRP